MYCKVCGNPMKESDTSCTVCGTAAEQPSKWADKKPNTAEELTRKDDAPIAQESIPVSNDFFVPSSDDTAVPADNGLTLEEELFGTAPKEEPINFFGTQEKKEPAATVTDPEFSWNVYDFPKPKKTENIEFDWGESHPKAAAPQEDKNNIESESFKTREFNLSDFSPTKELAEAAEEADQLFSFDEKNEEFQKLLDREYERLKNENPISQDNPSLIQRMEMWSEEHGGPARPSNLIAVEDDRVEKDRFPSAAGISSDRRDQEPIPVYITGMTPETAASLRGINGSTAEATAASAAKMTGTPEDVPDVKTARAQLAAAISAAEAEAIATAAAPSASAEAPVPVVVEAAPAPAAVEPAPETIQTVEVPEIDDAFESPVEVQSAETAEVVQTEEPAEMIQTEEPAETVAPETAAEPEGSAETAETAEPAAPELPQGTRAAREAAALEKSKNEEILPPLWFEQDDAEETEEKEPPKKSSRVGKVFLIIVIAVLLVEIVMLGIQFIAPNSSAAEAAVRSQAAVASAVEKSVDRIGSFFAGLGADKDTGSDTTDLNTTDTDKTTTKTDTTKTDTTKTDTKTTNDTDKTAEVVDTTPAADKNTLIKAAADSNKNIKKIEANPKLYHWPGRNYALEDITNSTDITDNVWQKTSSGKTVLYDQAIVTALISFDSQWTDYVNGGSDAVIDLTKYGSKAYRDATTYSKVGKIKESFDLLQIGDIQKGSEGYYVWTYEEITQTSGGVPTKIHYHWIYYLEPVDGAMKIVSYIKY